MSIKQLHTIEDLHQFVQQPGQQLFFKHSTSCPISAKAYEEFQAFVKETDTPAAVVLMIEDRPVSNKLQRNLELSMNLRKFFFWRMEKYAGMLPTGRSPGSLPRRR